MTPTLPAGTVIVVPCFGNLAGALKVASEIPDGWLKHTLFVDDGSQPALAMPGLTVLRHPQNRGYGGAQKTGYTAALARGADRVVLLHGDAQYPTLPTLNLAWALIEADADVALGSRFLHHGGRAIPFWRRWGNRALTGVANHRFACHLSELHTGARAFSAAALRRLPLDAMSDDYVFDQQALAALLAEGLPFVERPVEARYDAGVQSISFRRSVAYGLGCLATMAHPLPLRPPGGQRGAVS